MSGLEVVGCVAAVVSAFHGGAELVKVIKKKHKKRRAERDFQEKQLEDSLVQGEQQVSMRYCAEYDVFGAAFTTGDRIATDQLLQIAVSMQAEIIRSLQIACAVEDVILDMTRLHEASVTNRHDTMRSLNDLKQRILVSLPIGSPLGNGSVDSGSTRSGGSILSYITAHAVSPDMIPAAVTLPQDQRGQGFGRLLSVRTPGRQRSSSGNSRISLAPSFTWLSPLIHSKELDMGIFTHASGTVKEEPERHSIRSRFDSITSGKAISRQPSTASGSSLNSPLLSPTSPQLEISPPQLGATVTSFPAVPEPPQRHPDRPSVRPGIANFRPLSLEQQASNPHLVHPLHRPSLPPTTSTPVAPRLHGRPEKTNNYWGFCKGAWSSRETVKKGLAIHMVPNGLYGQTPYWQCKRCQFRTPAVGRDRAIPDVVHTASCGIRYKWLFLARSHVKCENPTATKEEYSFGCMFCSIEGRETGIYGNVDTLLSHVDMRHKGSITEEVMRRSKCVVGREPRVGEDWDIYVPAPGADR